jgi:hypothetical protein
MLNTAQTNNAISMNVKKHAASTVSDGTFIALNVRPVQKE